MKTGPMLLLLGGAQIYLGLQPDPLYRLLLWSGTSFILVGLGYGRLGARVFGKRSDGAISWWNGLLLFPYLLFTWALWHLQRLLSKEDICNEVVPGIWIGRRPLVHELPAGISLIVDLTAEFPAARRIKPGRDYCCVPILDASTPNERDFRELLTRIAAWNGPVYIHCASGHGRSAMVVIALLMSKGLVNTLDEGEMQVKQARPQIGLSASQRSLLERSDWLTRQ